MGNRGVARGNSRAHQPRVETIRKGRFDFAETKGCFVSAKSNLLFQWEIAELLAVTPEHTSRVLRRLEKEGLISRKRNILFVLDAQRLASFLDGTWPLRSDDSPRALAEGPAGRIKSGHLSQCVANKGSHAASRPPHIAAHEHIQDSDKNA